MKFDDLDKKMRIYEESIDQVILPDMYMVARLDGKSFTRLTKEICQFEAPFDVRFRDMMVDTVKQLLDCGFRVVYGYTESDEISLLFHVKEDAFGRKVRKYNSVLAGVASVAFSQALGQMGIFDCRMVPLPNKDRVKDYFRWRQEDAHRNSLNSHCYWLLRKQGISVQEATNQLAGKSVGYKNELLYQAGINYNELPTWQKRGVGVWWEEVEKIGFNPVKQESVRTTRREIHLEYELPIGDAYEKLIERFLE